MSDPRTLFVAETLLRQQHPDHPEWSLDGSPSFVRKAEEWLTAYDAMRAFETKIAEETP